MPDNVASQFVGLPIKDLIASPLTAACDSQIDLANAMVKFIKLLAYENGNDGTPLTLPMTLQRPVQEQDGTIGVNTITAAPPLLGLVPIPALLIDSVDITFTMEVSAHSEDKSSTDKEAEVTATGSVGFGPWKASITMHGKVASHRENTRSTDQTAKYDVKVHAGQQAPTEGMSKLMDLLASCVDPIKIEPASA